MKKIVLMCSNGMSTSLMVAKMREAEFAVLVPAHAVVQAVDGLAVSRHVKKHLAGFVDEGDDLRVDLHGAAVINDGVKILQRQVFSV